MNAQKCLWNTEEDLQRDIIVTGYELKLEPGRNQSCVFNWGTFFRVPESSNFKGLAEPILSFTEKRLHLNLGSTQMGSRDRFTRNSGFFP